MKVEQFAQWASDYAVKHGVRPKSISMSRDDVKGLYADLESKDPAFHPSRVAQFIANHGDKQVAADGSIADRYALTLLGVDVYCE